MTLAVSRRCLTFGFCVRQASKHPTVPVYREDEGGSSPGIDAG